ncbi:MAG: hypothetical protein JO142_21535 [Burkholderiales bacterium]|nr:hypothetical protein [Burkholderiales bacterium]
MIRHAAILIALALAWPTAEACTLWGAAGAASAEGTLLAKNRDWKPDHIQSVRLVHPADKLSYLGLFADTGSEPGLKGGVNEAGVSVVSAEASSLPKAVRDAEVQHHRLLSAILTQYHSLDEVSAHADALFTGNKPVFLLIGDAHGLMRVEIGQDGKYAITRSANGILAHTNHYLDTSLISTPQKIGPSSATRLSRVDTLLAEHTGTYTLADFARISADRHDGPDNSLWRNGHEYTLAGWQIALPEHAAPHLHLVLANPGEAERKVDWTLDKAFWAQPEGVLLGGAAAPAA